MLRVVCLVSFLAYAGAIVCPPNACELVRCAAVIELTCNGIISRGGGYCGCCDACLKELNEGDQCMDHVFLGVPSTGQCTAGTHCDLKTFRCIRDSGPCTLKANAVKTRSLFFGVRGQEVPRCDADGNYEGMQFAGSQAYCVTKNGTAISGYMVNIWEAGNMTCDCARDQYEYMQTGLIGKLFFCAPNGNYKSHQHTKRDAPTCVEELARITVELFVAQQSGHHLLGLEKPHCDDDGNYAPVQYKGSQAYCVTKYGTAIDSYMVNRWEAQDMNCQCARDLYDYMQTGLIGKLFHCEANGNYKKVQCTGSVCYCVDMYGHQQGTSTVPISDMDKMNC